eukprot:187191_1
MPATEMLTIAAVKAKTAKVAGTAAYATFIQFGNVMTRRYLDQHMKRTINMNYKNNPYLVPKSTAFTNRFFASMGRHTAQIIHNQQTKDLKASCDHMENAIFYYRYDKLQQFQSSLEKSFDSAMEARANTCNVNGNPNYLLGVYNNLIFTGFWNTAWDKYDGNLDIRDVDCIAGLDFIHHQLQKMNEEVIFQEYVDKYKQQFMEPKTMKTSSGEQIFYDSLRRFGFDTTEFVTNIQSIAIDNQSNAQFAQNEDFTYTKFDKLFYHLRYDPKIHDTEYLKLDFWCPNPDKYIYFTSKQLLLPDTKRETMKYVVIREDCSYECDTKPLFEFEHYLKQYQQQNKKISVIALGPDNSFAIVCEDGEAIWRCSDQEFGAVMREIDTKDIKQISFGPDDSFAIVMKSGYCCAYMVYDKHDGPFEAIAQNQSNIIFVAMTGNKSEWIVGYRQNGGWMTQQYGIADSAFYKHLGWITQQYGNAVKADKEEEIEYVTFGSRKELFEIEYVTFGSRKELFVIKFKHGKGWGYDKNELGELMDQKYKHVAIW